MGKELLPDFIRTHYEIHEWRRACAILSVDFPEEWRDLIEVLGAFRFRTSQINVGGGRKSEVANALDSAFNGRGWRERKFDTKILVDEEEIRAPTHRVDCFKNGVALEIEWNNKDPFYDRDLNNFRLLFDLRAISVGVIVTRRDELQTLFDALGRGKSYGPSTTHMSRLLPRLAGGSGGGCPILVFGISKRLYVDDGPPERTLGPLWESPEPTHQEQP
jgi:hypothetical protein